MRTRIDLTGRRFFKWVVLREVNKNERGQYCWACLCDCGVSKIVSSHDLMRGHSKSCGCFRKEDISKRFLKHGQTKTKEYQAWLHMKARCYYPNSVQYKDWGGRGITVCDRWLESFENFIADMGNKPSKSHSLDRYPDKDGNYEPGNCRWATKQQQSENTRKNKIYYYKGKSQIIEKWAKELGAYSSNITRSLRRGKTIDEIFKYYEDKLK